jgi:hypothetical protein
MPEVISTYKELGIVGFVIIMMVIAIITLFKYLCKSHNTHNNIMENHISHSNKIMEKVNIALIEVKSSNDALNQTLRDIRASVDRLLDRL